LSRNGKTLYAASNPRREEISNLTLLSVSGLLEPCECRSSVTDVSFVNVMFIRQSEHKKSNARG
jgi:hypothetical protein